VSVTRPILWAVGTFAGIGLAATIASDRMAMLSSTVPQQPAPPPAAAPTRPTAAAPLPASPGIEIIVGDQRGHFSVDGRVDGTRIQLIVDTGASLVVLREEDAERVGIHLRRSDFTGRSQTANGTGTYAPVTLRSLRIGPIEVRDVPAAVVPRGQLGINLLGMSFLRRLRSFDIANNRITLKG
jgi:aspartyl protease family protein